MKELEKKNSPILNTKDILPKLEQHPTKGFVLNMAEKKHLADFFSVLIEIDQRNEKCRKEADHNEKKI